MRERERGKGREIRAVKVKTARNKGGKMAALWQLCMSGKLDEVRAELARGGDVNIIRIPMEQQL